MDDQLPFTEEYEAMMRHKKIDPIPVYIRDVLSMEERRLLRDAVEHYRDNLVPVSETGEKELWLQAR